AAGGGARTSQRPRPAPPRYRLPERGTEGRRAQGLPPLPRPRAARRVRGRRARHPHQSRPQPLTLGASGPVITGLVRVLGIETSCDDTAAAVVTVSDATGQRPRGRILSDVVHTQAAVHERFDGVVPELASRAPL